MKKLLALFLAILMAVSCFGCDTIPVIGGKDPVVVDDEQYTLQIFGEDCFYALPRIEYKKDGTEALNRQIRDKLYIEFYNRVKEPSEKGDIPEYGSMSYFWGYRNGYMSIVELCPICASEGREFFVFNMDMKTMQFTDAYSLLNAYGINKEDFLAKTRLVLAQTLYESIRNELNSSDSSERYQAEQLYARILSYESIAEAQPVIGENGALMTQCIMGGLYGLESFVSFLPFDTELCGEAKSYYENFDFSGAALDIKVITGETVQKYFPEIDATGIYRIPTVVCSEGQAEKVNKTLREKIDALLGNSLTAEDIPVYLGFNYEWAVKGKAVSLFMWADSVFSSWTEHLVLSFDILSGELLSDRDVMNLYGLYDENAFYEHARDRMGTEFVRNHGGAVGDDPYTVNTFNLTVDMDNVREVVPYVGEYGALFFLGKLGIDAGAGYIMLPFCYEGAISDEYRKEYAAVRVVSADTIFMIYTDHYAGIKYANFDFPTVIARGYKQAEANELLHSEIEKFLGSSLSDSVHGGQYGKLSYGWGVKEHYVSVWFWSHVLHADYDNYGAVTIDLTTGKAVSDSELLALFGITDMSSYTKHVEDRMGTLYLAKYEGRENDPLVIDRLILTCRENRLSAVLPVIGPDGTLYLAAPLGAVAGSGIDWEVFPYEGEISNAYKALYALYIK